MKFKNRVVFVTGGANGIGRAIVEAFTKDGAKVAFCDKDSSWGELLAEGCNALFVYGDVSDEKELESAMNKVCQELGEIDILVNNAGVSIFKPLIELEVEMFDSILDTNLRAMFISSRFMARSRERLFQKGEHKSGAIVNIASTRYLQSEPHSEAYAASKGGIVALTHALALSLSKYSVTVNSVSPGWINCDSSYVPSAIDNLQHPSQRVGVPSDIARAVLFLANSDNNFINGENLVVDGGMTKKMIYVE